VVTKHDRDDPRRSPLAGESTSTASGALAAPEMVPKPTRIPVQDTTRGKRHRLNPAAVA